ncbi:MAG: hypothetical protein D3923_08010, partial [Candidatus Electrothrix sp. AR3]|nr:hypothetical protein [Candidatus Electrothrix sp. AR3]
MIKKINFFKWIGIGLLSLLIVFVIKNMNRATQQQSIDVSLAYFENKILPQRKPPEIRGAHLDETQALHVFYVDCNDPRASDANPGTRDKPIKTINYIVNHVSKNKIPARIIVKPGVYREKILVEHESMSVDDPLMILEAEKKGSVTLSGSEIFSDWKKGNGYYTHHWPYTWGFAKLAWEHKTTKH